MSRYRKQILDLLHGLDKIRTHTMVHSTSLDGFEYIDMIRENNDRLLLNPGAYAINLHGKTYAFVLFERFKGPIYLIGTDAVKIEDKYTALYEFKPLNEDHVINNTVNASADYIVMSGMSIFKSASGENEQDPFSNTTITSIETMEYTLSGKKEDQYDKNTIGFSKKLKSLNDKDIFLIDHNARKALLINKVGMHYVTGNEDWKLYSQDDTSYIFSLSGGFINMDLDSPYIKCNYFPSKEFDELPNSRYGITIKDKIIYVKVPKNLIGIDNNFPQLKFKDYLKSKFFNKETNYNPVTILYKFKVYTYIASEVTDDYDFKMFYDTTKIECNHINNVSILCRNLKED